MKIIIGKPYVKKYGDKSRMESVISVGDTQKTYYFEVDNEYEKYFCAERSDAFFLGLLYFALVRGFDIQCEAPLSEKLYYQITNTYIPTVVNNDPELFNNIEIVADLDANPIKNEGAVGTSASGGIDSFYTIVSNMGLKSKNYNITHLLLTNSFNIYYDEKSTRARYEEICARGEIIANDLGKKFVKIYTNEHDFWYPHYVDLYCFRYMSLPYALQKLFAVYNYSTGYQFNDFTFKASNRDASHYDFFTVHLISNENLTIYSSGGEVGRPKKAACIADNPVVQKRLQVCNLHTENCSVCEKCLRTQFNFYACGKLEKFSEAFNINEFYKRKDKTLIGMLTIRGSFERENIALLKENKIEIPAKVIIMGGIGHTFYVLKQSLKKLPFIYTLYKKLKKVDENNEIVILDKYNLNEKFAKECNPDTIEL